MHAPAASFDRPMSPAAERTALALLLLAGLLLFGIGQARTGFQGTDEHRYAQVAKEVGPGADLFVMHMCGDLYPDKPPIFFWAIKASYTLLGGVTPLSARLPLILSGIGALAFAWLLMRQMSGPRLALLGTALLLLSFRFIWAGRWLRLDMPLVMFSTGAFWTSARLLFPHAGQRPAGGGWALAGWTLATLGTLTKATALPVWLGTLTLYAAWRRDWSVIRLHRPVAGPALALTIVAAWLIPAWVLGGSEYVGVILGVHVIERYVGLVHHEQWFGYFVPKLLSDGLPAALLLPAALWWGWRRRTDPVDGDRLRFLLAWIAFTFVFFSIPQGKRGQYILPLYPAMTLLVAQFIAEALTDAGGRLGTLLRRHLWVWCALLAAAGLAPLPLRRLYAEDFRVDPGLTVLIGVALLLTGSALWSMRLLRARRCRPVMALTGAGLYLTYVLLFALYFPRMFDDSHLREITAIVERESDDPRPLVGLYRFSQPFIPYGNLRQRTAEWSDDLRRFTRQEGGDWIVTYDRHIERAREALDPVERVRDREWRVLGSWPVVEGDTTETLVLIHLRPTDQ